MGEMIVRQPYLPRFMAGGETNPLGARSLSRQDSVPHSRHQSALDHWHLRVVWLDRWHLCKDASGRVFVLHQANIPSGGQTSHIELGDFLTRGYGPEQQALSQMIGTLIESTPGELLTGEGNPGLAVTGGSGHA